MAGKLFICATPIGNLEDITLRVIRTLKEVDVIACEDTRTSMKLCRHFEIKTPLTSYHEHNKFEKAAVLVGRMEEGETVALITDAGTPAISDPGEELVKQAYTAGIEVTSLPGAAACITALTLSGLSTGRFAFEAFLPYDKKVRKRILEELKTETRTIILYEAPHKLRRTLEELQETLGNRRLSLVKELTKIHEGVFRTNLEEALSFYQEEMPRGEYVLVLEGRDPLDLEKERQDRFEEMSLSSHLAHYMEKGLTKKEAMKKMAEDRGKPKREIYKLLLLENENVGGGYEE